MNNYQKNVFDEIKRGLINRQEFSREEMQFLIRTEKLLHDFSKKLKSIQPDHPIFSLQVAQEDMFIKSNLIDGIQSGTISRYPLGWGDRIEKYDAKYSLPKDSTLGFWIESTFSVVMTEFVTFPKFEFNSLAHYVTFIGFLIIGKHEIAESVLKNVNICKESLGHLVNCKELKFKEPLLLFYLFKGSSLKMNSSKKALNDLNSTQGNIIISSTCSCLDETLGHKNYFGKMLTVQREARKRLNLI